MPKHNVSRRSFLQLSGGAVALAGLGLVGCGGGSDNGGSAATTEAEPQEGVPATTALDQLPMPEVGKTYNNPLDRDQIQDGGTLTLPTSEIGPNWNMLANEGNTVYMKDLWQHYMPIQMVLSDATNSTYTANPDYITDFSVDTSTGKEVVTVDFNPEAKFNDDTPIDYRALAAIVEVMSGKNSAYTPASTDGYDKVESVEQGANAQQAVITFADPVYPFEPIIAQCIHPDAADPDVFNSGWNNEPHNEWGAGPFVVDSHDDTQVTFVPNPNWWGDKPKLDTVVYKQMDSQATYNAFKNGEIDSTGFPTSGNQEMLSNFSGMDDAEIRRAYSTSTYCIEINATRGVVSEEAVRKAFSQCIDTPTLLAVMFQGVNWSEERPGSLLSPIWADGYENNLPDDVTSNQSADDKIAAAKKTLEDAGYAMGDDGYYAKDGQTVKFGFTTFGDANTTKNRAAAIQKMAKDAGMDVEIDNKPASEFSKTLTGGDWDTCAFGWNSTPGYVWNAPQIYGSDSASNFTHLGSAELDEELDKVITIEDHTEQLKAFNAAEKKAMASYGFIPMYAGPDVVVCKKGLANVGPALFQDVLKQNVGWAKE